MAKNTFMSRVKAYRKLHPRSSQVDAMKKLAGKKPAKRKVGATKTGPKMLIAGRKPKKRSITKTERITTIGRKKSSSPVQRGVNISKKIDDLELLLKNTSGTTAKNHVKRLINAEHDKLDAITKNLKSA